MAAFSYKALNASGRNVSGVLEADTVKQVRQMLRDKGLVPVAVQQAAEKEKRSPQKNSFVSFFQPKVSASDLALITRQLATLVQSALPIEEALLAVAEQCEKTRIKNMIMAVRSKVVEGYNLADSMSEFPHIFDNLYCAMVAAGEKSGHLDTVFDRLADFTEKRQQTRSQIMQALAYPMILTLFAVGIVSFLLASVVPKIVSQFDNMGQDLPPITEFLIGLSDFVRDSGHWILLVIILLVVAFARLMTITSFRLSVHRNMLSWPLIGKLVKSVNTARFARTLSILAASGVPLMESMKISGEVLANDHAKKNITQATNSVREGSSLRVALQQTKLFPPMMLHMIASGEKSGELQQMLERAAENQERDFEVFVNVSLKIFEPIMVATMAAVVLFIVMAILQPILALNNLVGV